jgi:hypothetical protein
MNQGGTEGTQHLDGVLPGQTGRLGRKHGDRAAQALDAFRGFECVGGDHSYSVVGGCDTSGIDRRVAH